MQLRKIIAINNDFAEFIPSQVFSPTSNGIDKLKLKLRFMTNDCEMAIKFILIA